MKSTRIIAAAFALLGAAGCSVLTVNIDVYKGPLGSDEALQVREFAALPAAARPLLIALRNSLDAGASSPPESQRKRIEAYGALKQEDKQKLTELQSISCKKTSEIGERNIGARFVNDAISAYFDKVALVACDPESAARLLVGREDDGIDTLLQNLLENYKSSEPVDVKKRPEFWLQLENALVTFATKVAYFANNEYLLRLGQPDIPDADRAKQVQMVSLLQALGNTILVQADDFSRKRRYASDQRVRANVERQAYREAQNIAPSQVLSRIAEHVAGKRAQAEADLQKIPEPKEGAAAGLKAANEELKRLDNEATAAKKKREDERTAALPVYAALQTATVHTKDIEDKDLAPGDPKIASDHTGLLSAIGTSATATRDSVLAAVQAWLAGEIEKQRVADADKPDTRVQRLVLAAKYFADKASVPDLGSKPAPDYFVRIVSEARASAATRRAAYEGTSSPNETAKKAVETQRFKVEKIAAQEKEEATATKTRGELGERVRNLVAAEVAIGELRESVLYDVTRKRTFEPAAVLANLRSKLSAAGDKAGDASKAAPYAAALAASSDLTFSAPAPSIVDVRSVDPKSDTAKDVLDDVLTLLRQQEIQAEATGEKKRADNFRAAIARALKQRADMAYLRPPQAYLRSIYTASALQTGADDPGANLLWRQLIGGPLGWDTTQDRRYKDAREQLDKLSWQNINTVRVTGAGAANYVVAKDDVGNWYVKGFEADPQEIYNSVRSMALFNYGRQIDVNLLRRLDVQRMLDDPATSGARLTRLTEEHKELMKEPTKGGTDALGGAIARYGQRYLDDARTQAVRLRSALAGIRESLDPSWSQIDVDAAKKKEFVARLKELTLPADPNLLEAIKVLTLVDVDTSTLEELNTAIVKALRNLRRYKTAATAGMRNDQSLLDLYKDATEAAQAKAKTARADAANQLDEHLRSAMNATVLARLQAIREYETALMIIGDVSK